MSESPDERARRIAELEAELRRLKAGLPAPESQQPAHIPPPGSAGELRSTVEVGGSAQISGAVVGVNYGTVQTFFGGAPGENGEALLADYLDALIGECEQLRLYRLTGRRQSGAEQGTTPPLRLQAVYTSLTTDGPLAQIYKPRQRTAARLSKLIERAHLLEYSLEAVSPECARVLQIASGDVVPEALRADVLSQQAPRRVTDFVSDDTTPEAMLTLRVVRPQLATEAIRQHPRLVLLGEPGAGKSTVLRYLALLLAQQLRGVPVDLPGWPAGDLPVPILCPLGMVATALPACGGDASRALWRVLGDLLEGPQGLRAGLRDHLKPALRNGGVLLLCDGLDELPAAGDDGAPGPRQRVAAALRQFAAETRARIVVTSRVLPYRTPGDWKLSGEQIWHERTIQPLAFGQVRMFVQSWYGALAASDPTLTADDAGRRTASLIAELEANERVRPLVRSPLLLTMLAILHYNTDEVPRDRARLYNECVQLLLERWEPVRTPGLERPGLLARLGDLPGLDLDLLRGVIHELAFLAHDRPPGADGRGLLDGDALEGRMLRFFRQLRCPDPATKVEIFLQMLREDAGLLQARADDRYAFPHLTFQEYLAACHLADRTDMAELAYVRWHGADSERWREVFLLLVGRLRQQGPKAVERDGVPWLQSLAAARRGRQDKPPAQRRRDAVLAALSYAELGGRAALANSLLDVENLVEQPLRQAIVDLLAHPDPAITLADRLAAARLLADLGDPRFPVTIEEWRREFARRNERFGEPQGYWCFVRPGMYRIGGWEKRKKAAIITLPAFWIARFPITVAQYAPFVEAGYDRTARRWWTPNGWRWKDKSTEPWGWNKPPYDGLNQPLIGVTWYEATAFCAWLTEQLAGALPADYTVRLPTQAEWEAAASFDVGMHRRSYPWGEDEPTPELAIYDASNLDRPAPVGCCSAGAAVSGALDMAGNVWEMVASRYQGYPEQSDQVIEDFTTYAYDVPWCGGGWIDNSSFAHCAARNIFLPSDLFDCSGFRVVVAPRS